MKLMKGCAVIAAALALGSVAPAEAASRTPFAVSIPGGTVAGSIVWNPRTATVDAVLTGHRQDRWTTAFILAYSGDVQVGAWTQGVLDRPERFSAELGDPDLVDRVTAQVCVPVGKTRERCSAVKELHRR
ncbi:hypothetical protein [Lentzea sp. NPDC051838]|uniref:hypothetical protein n=1 Tax=Lentzea sp. NPDC051838 TaxID=3154849 RepID=UPI0034478ECC